MSDRSGRGLMLAGALAGLSGIVLASLAAHVTGGGNLEVAANFLLFHAPVLLVVPVLTRMGVAHDRLAGAAGLCIAVGLVLFCGDLSLRALAGIAPVRMAAPVGGVILLAGWALLAVAALVPRRAG